MTAGGIRMRPDDLGRFVEALFCAAGFSEEHARTEAEVLVWANLRGVDSHGIFRVAMYVRAIRSGAINPAPQMRVVSQAAASCVIEADRAAGPVAMTFTMNEAVRLAHDHALGWALVRNTTHTGPMGYYARLAAARDMIGIVASASKPIMAFHGTRVPAASTNPIAIAVPGVAAPLVLDMGTAAIAWGRLAQARQSGTRLGEGVALDAGGRPTTDPATAVLPLPLAGAKGAGLSLMIECLTSLLAGMPLIEPSLAGTGDGPRAWQHGLAIAVDIAAFTDVGRFKADAAALAAAIKAQPRAEGFDEVLMPGERGDREAAERRAQGIPIAEEQWRELVEVARSLGVEAPAV